MVNPSATRALWTLRTVRHNCLHPPGQVLAQTGVTMRSSARILSAALALLTAWPVQGLLSPAHAALGDTVASIQADRTRLKGALRIRAQAGYSVQQITTPAGTVVNEYVSGAGVVFAVTWRGPAVPDLQQLLGRYFAQAHATAAAQPPAGHGQLAIRGSDLVVRASGHLRAFFGLAYVPSLLPPNFSPSLIQ